MEDFPERNYDDQVDGLPGAFNALLHKPAKVPKITAGFDVVGRRMRMLPTIVVVVIFSFIYY